LVELTSECILLDFEVKLKKEDYVQMSGVSPVTPVPRYKVD